jgi:hypothetical protein
MPAKDYETGLDIPGRYSTRFLFECYDITTTPHSQETNGSSAVWNRGTKDARTILYYLSKDIRVLEFVRNGQPYSTATTYLINLKLDYGIDRLFPPPLVCLRSFGIVVVIAAICSL